MRSAKRSGYALFAGPLFGSGSSVRSVDIQQSACIRLCSVECAVGAKLRGARARCAVPVFDTDLKSCLVLNLQTHSRVYPKPPFRSPGVGRLFGRIHK